MISRTLVILMAFGAALYRASQGAVIETIGLTALGVGLAFLRIGETKPQVRRWAWLSFGVTVMSMVVVLLRLR